MKEKLRKPLTALMMAWGTYLAIPCPYKVWDDALRPWQIVCLPPVGLVVGGIWALCAGIFAKLGFTGFLAAAILAAVPFLVTGFFHLDGFLDCCDAILSRRDLATRQKILKDSRVGAFAVVSAVLLFLLSFAALADCSFSLIWRALLFSIRRAAIGRGSGNRRAVTLYHHICWLARRTKTEVPAEFLEIAEKARFSHHKLSREELQPLQDHADQLTKQLLADKRFWRQFIYRVIYALG